MEYKLILSEEFKNWRDTLSLVELEDVQASLYLLKMMGVNLSYPYSSKINDKSIKTKHMRELRIQHKGSPYRILYAFSPEQKAILLIGGCKTNDKRWYKKNVPIADKIYQEYIKTLDGGQ